jgi:DnaJ family protein C protein 28
MEHLAFVERYPLRRLMDKWEPLIDRLIRESMERGEFENLQGSGEPIDLSENPFEAPEVRTAHRLLRNAGFAPAWIEERKDIDASFQRARDVLVRARKLYWRLEGQDNANWKRAVREFRECVDELNQRIRLYNLKAPASNFHRTVIDVEQVLNDLVK